MDDNKLLTLANGERIRLQSHCAMLFEVGDLQYASPATVSRCGMVTRRSTIERFSTFSLQVFVDPKDLKYRPFWTRWIGLREKKEEQKCLNMLFDKFVPTLITLILEGIIDGKQGEKLKQIIPLTNLNMVNRSLFCSSHLFRFVFDLIRRRNCATCWKVFFNRTTPSVSRWTTPFTPVTSSKRCTGRWAPV